MAMTIDGTSGATFPDGSIQASSGGMTLLGTITPTAVNSVSLGSLTLTNYKSLFIVFNTLGQSGTGINAQYISSTNVQSGGGWLMNPTNCSGTALLDLSTGAIGGSMFDNTIATGGSTFAVGGLTDVTTSSTIIYFRVSSTRTFTATGSIKIYGVK